MKKIMIRLLTVFSFLCISTAASAVTIDLDNWAININGTLIDDSAEFMATSIQGWNPDSTADLGTFTWTTTTQGTHSFIAWFDYEIDQNSNGFSNETGATNGTVATGQSWEIDEPGFTNGDIFTNVEDGNLGNNIFTSDNTIDDVSFAIGWDFSLGIGDSATIVMTLTNTTPTGEFSNFYLSQADTEPSYNNAPQIFFSSTIDIERDPGTGGNPIPEPSTILLFGFGILGLAKFGRKQS